MRFHVNGFEWEATPVVVGKPLPSRSEAQAELNALNFPATNTKHYRQALAAFSVADYGQVIACCEAAREVAEPGYWQ